METSAFSDGLNAAIKGLFRNRDYPEDLADKIKGFKLAEMTGGASVAMICVPQEDEDDD
jgi:hypothetical protein